MKTPVAVQHARQLDPSVTSRRDEGRTEPRAFERCIWRTYSCSASAKPPGAFSVGFAVWASVGVELAAVALGPAVTAGPRKFDQAPTPAIPARIATTTTAAPARFRRLRPARCA